MEPTRRRPAGTALATTLALAFVLALLGGGALAGCSTATTAARPEVPSAGSAPAPANANRRGSSAATSTTAGTTRSSDHPSRPSAGNAETTLARSRREARRAIGLAWTTSIRAFYVAGRTGEPQYPPLVASFVPGSPALEQTVAWLTALTDAGVEAPATYRIGDVRVTSLSRSRAGVTGCMYDTGSLYRATGGPAPSSLGGGAGLTASVAVLKRVQGRWLVWSDQTSAPSSTTEEGPCHDFRS